MAEDMRALVQAHGVNSFKFFMAYKGALMARPWRRAGADAAMHLRKFASCAYPARSARRCPTALAQVSDAELLAGMRQCRALGAVAMVHAENGDGVEEGRAAVFAAGVTGPEGHALSRPAALEAEATGRAIALAACVLRMCKMRCHARSC